ncbi:hypothetical protein Hanom_Chr01g00006961 [Helianthus anomalus]
MHSVAVTPKLGIINSEMVYMFVQNQITIYSTQSGNYNNKEKRKLSTHLYLQQVVVLYSAS